MSILTNLLFYMCQQWQSSLHWNNFYIDGKYKMLMINFFQKIKALKGEKKGRTEEESNLRREYLNYVIFAFMWHFA